MRSLRELVRAGIATLWATLNGVLDLTEHSLRRELIGVERETLFEAALKVLIQGLRATPSQ